MESSKGSGDLMMPRQEESHSHDVGETSHHGLQGLSAVRASCSYGSSPVLGCGLGVRDQQTLLVPLGRVIYHPERLVNRPPGGRVRPWLTLRTRER